MSPKNAKAAPVAAALRRGEEEFATAGTGGRAVPQPGRTPGETAAAHHDDGGPPAVAPHDGQAVGIDDQPPQASVSVRLAA